MLPALKAAPAPAPCLSCVPPSSNSSCKGRMASLSSWDAVVTSASCAHACANTVVYSMHTARYGDLWQRLRIKFAAEQSMLIPYKLYACSHAYSAAIAAHPDVKARRTCSMTRCSSRWQAWSAAPFRSPASICESAWHPQACERVHCRQGQLGTAAPQPRLNLHRNTSHNSTL